MTNSAVNAATVSSGMIAFFFLAILSKGRTAASTDAKRRLRILLVGSAIGLLPLVALVVYEGLGKNASQDLIIPVVLIFLLFPIALAYVIVAERAMNLRMVIRQGLRYTLARGGLRLVLGLITIGALVALNNALFGSDMSSPTKITLSVIAGVLFVFLIRRTRLRLTSGSTSGFRDTYNAELLLEELSDHVRSIVDEQELLETVGKKISETLHVPQFAFLRQDDGICRPVYCLGFEPQPETAVPQQSKTFETLTNR